MVSLRRELVLACQERCSEQGASAVRHSGLEIVLMLPGSDAGSASTAGLKVRAWRMAQPPRQKPVMAFRPLLKLESEQGLKGALGWPALCQGALQGKLLVAP